MPAGELAPLQRVQQLQALIESASQVAAGMLRARSRAPPPPSGSSSREPATDFASALQAATTRTSPMPPGQPNAGRQPGVDSGRSERRAGGEYEALIDQAAARNGVDPAVLHGLIQQESGFDPTATSSAGALGLTQLMPGTASSLGVANPLDPAESIEGGARYLGQMMGQLRRQHRRRARRLQRRPRGRPAVRRRAAVLRNPELRLESARLRRNLPPVPPRAPRERSL